MNASTPFGFLQASVFFAALTAATLVACSGKVTSTAPSTEAQGQPSTEQGGPAQCPAFLGDCQEGDSPADLNGDGCIDGCKTLRCTGKACGTDCSPSGSDEPFNCNARGQCVATGADLGCAPPKCPEFLGDCREGDGPADLDGDGCIDGCKTLRCTGKACGTDCSPAGSDEPFNCNARGQCVATGAELGCAPPK